MPWLSRTRACLSFSEQETPGEEISFVEIAGTRGGVDQQPHGSPLSSHLALPRAVG